MVKPRGVMVTVRRRRGRRGRRIHGVKTESVESRDWDERGRAQERAKGKERNSTRRTPSTKLA